MKNVVVRKVLSVALIVSIIIASHVSAAENSVSDDEQDILKNHMAISVCRGIVMLK